jgi:hypothetical protein
MRLAVLAFALLLLACSTASRRTNAQPDMIEVVSIPGVMFYSIEDGGVARFVSGLEDYTFESSREDFRRIRAMLQPLETRGIPCSDPARASSSPGYIRWRRNGIEREISVLWSCYGLLDRSLARHSDRAFQAMWSMARERWRPPPMPMPTRIAVQWASWGRPLEGWYVQRGGEGRYTDGDQSLTFPVSAEAFDRIRDVFRPHEGARFECDRVVTDMPYATITWSQEGMQDQGISVDAGCISGDATALFERLDSARAMVLALRDNSPH